MLFLSEGGEGRRQVHLLFMGLGRKLMDGSVFSMKSEARPSAEGAEHIQKVGA